MKKWILIFLPYILTIAIGISSLFLVYFDKIHSTVLREFFIGIAATFSSIPVLYFAYDKTKKMSERQLTIEIFEYAKVQVDQEILSIINKLQKIIFPYSEKKSTFENVNKFLSINEHVLENKLKSNNFLGFQIFKKWDIDANELHNILKNPFILQHLEKDTIISIIELLKKLRLLENILTNKKSFLEIKTSDLSNYKVVHGNEVSSFNNKFPERCLLLQEIYREKYVVTDFGDFYKADKGRLLLSFQLNNEFIKPLSATIYTTIITIKEWLRLTGNDFLIDGKKFRIMCTDKNNSKFTPSGRTL